MSSGPSELTIVQLTDTHLRPAGELLRDTVDTHANLLHVLELVRSSGQRIDALVLSGDLTDDGSPAAYRRLRAAVEPVAAELDARIVYAMGNHDERVAFGTELLGRADVDPEQPHDQCVDIDGLRVLVLDSTTPLRHDGHLEPAQLTWLAAQLREPAPRGTLLVIHHPPLPSSVPATDLLKLDNADELAAVVAGTDVRLIVSGHNHLTAAAAVAGIPVWIGPALAYRLDPMAPVGRQRGFTGFGYSRIDLVGDTMLATAIEATPAAPVYDRDETEILDQIIAHVAKAR